MQPESNQVQAFATWRAELEGRGLCTEQLAELEDHFYSACDERSPHGESAHLTIIATMGDPHELATEYRKRLQMNPLSRPIGILITLAMLAAAIAPITPLTRFVYIPSALIVAGLVTGGLVASFGPRAILLCLQQACASSPPAGKQIAESLRLARHGYRLSWAAGAVGVVVGTICLLNDLGDPGMIGRGLALALLSLLYGALVAELCFANLSQWLERHAHEGQSARVAA